MGQTKENCSMISTLDKLKRPAASYYDKQTLTVLQSFLQFRQTCVNKKWSISFKMLFFYRKTKNEIYTINPKK